MPDSTSATPENGADAIKAAQARARAGMPITLMQAAIVMAAAQVKARAAAKARQDAASAPPKDELGPGGKLKASPPNIGQALAVLTMASVTSLIKNMAIKIDGEWIDTTTMGTTLKSAGDVANKEGQPSVFSDCELKLKLEYDFNTAPPVGLPPDSCSIVFGPSGAMTLAGLATLKSVNIDGALDGSVTTYDAELKFSGLVTLG